MTSAYPSAVDTFVDPLSTDTLDSATVPHNSQHANANDSINAIETALGTNPQGSYATVVARLNAMNSGLVTYIDGGLSSSNSDAVYDASNSGTTSWSISIDAGASIVTF